MRLHPIDAQVTRRKLLQGSGLAAAGSFFGLRAPSAFAATSSASVPGYLTRATYEGLSDPTFTASSNGDSVALTLNSIGDIAADLAGSAEAFSLLFSAPGGANTLTQGIQTFSHPQLGSFPLFAVPVGADSSTQTYEVIVDRVIETSQAAAAAPKVISPSHAGTPGAAVTTPGPRIVRSVAAHQVHGAVVVTVELMAHAEVKSLKAWLMEGAHMLGFEKVAVHGHSASFRIHVAHHLRARHYELALATIATDGRESLAPHTVELH